MIKVRMLLIATTFHTSNMVIYTHVNVLWLQSRLCEDTFT